MGMRLIAAEKRILTHHSNIYRVCFRFRLVSSRYPVDGREPVKERGLGEINCREEREDGRRGWEERMGGENGRRGWKKKIDMPSQQYLPPFFAYPLI